MRLRTPLVASATLALGLGLTLVPAASASAAPDTRCMRDGISVLKEVGLFSTVAKGGLPISVAVGSASPRAPAPTSRRCPTRCRSASSSPTTGPGRTACSSTRGAADHR